MLEAKLNDPTASTQNRIRTISGKRLVLGLFVFGACCTAGMGLYWKLHLEPFYALQRALADEFPKSSPRVDGGRQKNSPMLLRVSIQVKFPPREDDPRVEPIFQRMQELARQHTDLSRYAMLELYIVYRPPERPTEQLKREIPLQHGQNQGQGGGGGDDPAAKTGVRS